MKNKIMVKNKNMKKLQKLEKNRFRVAIFGSSKTKDKDPVYKRVKELAIMLGEKDIDLITGGGPGLMKAASEGHKLGKAMGKNNSSSIGIGVKLPWNQKFNEAVEYKKEFPVFSRRLDEFMLLSNAVIVEPGGIGTLLELFYTWQLVQVHHICNIPIILIGDTWDGLLDWIRDVPLKNKMLEKVDYNLVFHVRNSKEAFRIIEDTYSSWKIARKNYCVNCEKYKIK
jgi:hypothetical protein